MGIHGLSKLIADIAPSAIKENEMKNLFGRKVAIDASMSIYQFLVAVRHEGGSLTSVDGETTSHLSGMLYRTLRILESGIKPVYVFDGKPPELKSGELAKRAERREEAQKALAAAEEQGNAEDVEKFSRRLVKATRTHSEECRRLLGLMGVPCVEAPCEAEAQCAELVRAGKVYASATEDMDALTFGSSVLLRHLTCSEARKMPIKEFTLSKVLEEAGLSQDEFIDLCILLGCDYCDTIRGVGPKRAIELIQKYRSIEEVLEHLDKKKYTVPVDWNYAVARKLFIRPEVTEAKEIELKWSDPDEEGLVKFMCGEKGFSEDRMRNAYKRILKTRSGCTQGRLDSFFKVVTTTVKTEKRPANSDKGSAKKKAKTGGKFKGKLK